MWNKNIAHVGCISLQSPLQTNSFRIGRVRRTGLVNLVLNVLTPLVDQLNAVLPLPRSIQNRTGKVVVVRNIGQTKYGFELVHFLRSS